MTPSSVLDVARTLETKADELIAAASELKSQAAALRHAAAQPEASATLLTLDEACELTGLKMFSLRQLLASGRLQEVRFGRRRYVTRRSIDELGQAS